MAMSSAVRSPLRDAENPIPAPEKLPALPSVGPAIVNRASRDDQAAVTKVEKGGAGTREAERASRVVSWILQRDRRAAEVRRAAVGAHAAAAVLCLIAFSVMAADKNKGWALDSYDRYPEYRYIVAVNVIGFVYSGFQVFAQINHTKTGRPIIRRPMGHYFDFAMDQIMAYLLISASSSGASRTVDWVTNYGSDPFPRMARGSIAMSFLAFMAFAISSLISAFYLFTPDL